MGESIDLLANFRLSERMRLGLSYDITLSDIREYSNGSAEIYLEYTFTQRRQRVTNPRFF